MITLGLNVGKGTLRWVRATGTLDEPEILGRGWVDLDTAAAVPQAMLALDRILEALLDDYPVDQVAYRMHMGRSMTQAQIGIFHYPWGVVNLVCARRMILAVEFTGASLTAKRFGLSKGDKPMLACDRFLGTHPPHWDDVQRYAACAAWGALD